MGDDFDLNGITSLCLELIAFDTGGAAVGENVWKLGEKLRNQKKSWKKVSGRDVAVVVIFPQLYWLCRSTATVTAS